jgi:hypothetical protein
VLLITNGTFDLFADIPRDLVSGLVFNSMLSHLLQGDFAVDPSAIKFEAFLKDGRTYTYFGVAPALLRLPLLAMGKLATTDITALSIVIATAIAAWFQCASVVLIKQLNGGDSSFRNTLYIVLIISILVGGPQIQFLKSSPYQEVICWALALSTGFVYCAVRGLLLKRGFSPPLLAMMACLAGLTLLTRVSTAAGLYVAMGGLLMSLAGRQFFAIRPRSFSAAGKWLASHGLVPIVILAAFVILCGIVNYERWGNVFEVAEVHRNQLMVGARIAVIDRAGEFNIHRILFGAAYYLFPIDFISGPDGKFLFADFRAYYYDYVELPPSSFLVSDPLLLLLAAVFCWNLTRNSRRLGFDARHAGALALGLLAPIFLILTFYYAAFRYRGEFYPLLEFAALLGFFVLSNGSDSLSGKAQQRWQKSIAWCAIIGVIVSHILLTAYKASPFGSAERFLATGWINAYSNSSMNTW